MIDGTSRRRFDVLILYKLQRNDISDIILSIKRKLRLVGSTALDFQQELCFAEFIFKRFLGWLGPH